MTDSTPSHFTPICIPQLIRNAHDITIRSRSLCNRSNAPSLPLRPLLPFPPPHDGKINDDDQQSRAAEVERDRDVRDTSIHDTESDDGTTSPDVRRVPSRGLTISLPVTVLEVADD